MRGINLLFVFGFLTLLNTLSASCIAEAYSKSCSSCPFDEYGKMDSSCYNKYKSSGITCLSATYPLASAKYAQGICPQIDSCLSNLESCKAQYSSGNDRADCQEGSVSVCFASADACVRSAALKCEGIEGELEPCRSSLLGMLVLLVLVGIAKYRKI